MPLPVPAVSIIWIGIPTSDPEVEGAIWNDATFLRISSGFVNGLLNFSLVDHSQYLALLNEDF